MRALVPVAIVAAVLPSTAFAQLAELAQVQRHLKAVRTMTADFAQTDRSGKVLTGTLTMERPGKVRFQYQKGVPLLIVGDGKALTMIDYQVRQVSRWPIGDSPLSVLLNPDRDLAGIAKIVPAANPDMLLVQGRDPKRPEFGTITIAFRKQASAPGGLVLDGWTVVDAQNNRSVVALSGQKMNVAVPANAFRWIDPRPKGRTG